jgi:zinc protease
VNRGTRRVRGVPGVRGRALAAVLAATVVSCAARPFVGDTGIRPFAFDLWDVHCPSGLRVIFERAPGALTAGVTAVVGAGSAEDPAGREGLAHLVEHLTFRARNADSQPLRARLWSVGADYNAETGFDETTYHAFAPGQSLRALLQLEAARLLDPLQGLDEATFAVERDVVRNELRERNETHTFGAAFEAAYRTAFPSPHPYARPVAGSHDSLSALTLNDARRFVAAHYRPEKVTMVVVGDMDLAKVDAFVRETLPPALYGDPSHPRPVAPPPTATREIPAAPARTGLRRERAPVTTPELWISWALPGGHGPDQDVAEMWSTLTLQNFSRGRLADDDVGDIQLFASPGVRGSIFICRVELTEGKHPEASLRQVMEALPWISGDEVFLETRFRHLKLSRLRELAFDAESVISRSRRRAEYAYLTGNAGAYGATIETIKSITSDQARSFAERYLGVERARAVFVEPLGDGGPAGQAAPTAAAPAPDTDRKALPAITLRNLAALRHLGGLRAGKLDNGLELVVLPRPGAPVVTATLAFHGDRAAAGTGLPAAAAEALEVRAEESPGDYGISFEMSVGLDLAAATVRAGAGNLSRALDILAFATRSIDLDWPSDKFRETKLPLLRRQEASPQTRGERAVWKALFHGHPLGELPSADQMAARTARELENWLGRVVTPANGALVIVGDIDPAEAEAAARDAFSGLSGHGAPLPRPAPVAPRAAGPGAGVLDAAGGVIVTHRPGATQAALQLRCLLPPADVHGDAVHEVLADVVFARLEDDLRDETGATYGVHVSTSTLRGGTAYLTLDAEIANARLTPALGTLRRFWRYAPELGITAENVSRARDSLVSSRMLQYDTSRALAGELVAVWNQGWPLSSIDDAPANFGRVNATEVNAALRACAGNLVAGIIGDERVIRAALAATAPEPAPTSAPPASAIP